MLLTIDIGNTNMVFAVFKDHEFKGSFRLSTNSTATSDEVGIMAVSYFERFGYKSTDVKACIIGSVVPQVMYSVTSAVIKYFCVEPLVVGTDVDAGLKFDPRCYETGKLGADRAINCVAALEKYPLPFMIVDFGTATTIDVVNEEGVYVGGTIGPGLRVSLDALVSRTAMLPRVELQLPDTVLGRNTVEQIQAGVVAGYVGNIDCLIDAVLEEMNWEKATVIATGGLSRLISGPSRHNMILDRNLTMEGLELIFDRNKDAKPIEVKDI